MTPSDEQFFGVAIVEAAGRISANMNDKDTTKKRHPWVSYTLRFLYQTRLTLHLEEHDRSSLVVAISIVGLSISKSKSMSCKGP